jgi:plasmid stability protein
MKSFLVRNIPDETMTELKIICAKKNTPINTMMLELIENLIREEKENESKRN